MIPKEHFKENQVQIFEEFTLVKNQTTCAMWMEMIKSNNTVFSMWRDGVVAPWVSDHHYCT